MQKLVKFNFFLFILIQIPLGQAQTLEEAYTIRSVMTEEVFQSIQQISQVIMTECSPPECQVIGVGRSPAAIMAYLEAKQPDSTIDLPLSSFKYTADPTIASNLSIKGLSQNELNKLYNYFDTMIKNTLNPSTTKIILVDFATTGLSLYSTQSLLFEYFKNRNIQIEVKSMALGSQSEMPRVRSVAAAFKILPANRKVIGLKKNSALFSAFMQEKFEPFSNYEKFELMKIESDNPLPIENRKTLKNYFKDYIRRRIQAPKETSLENCKILWKFIFTR